MVDSENYQIEVAHWEPPRILTINNQPKLDQFMEVYLLKKDSIPRNVGEETNIEVEPSEVTEILPKCCEIENELELLSEAYHLVYGGVTKSSLESLTKIKTPTQKNTVLHMASMHGNDEIVDLITKRFPLLLFRYNANDESPLHFAARAKNIRTLKKLLVNYGNVSSVEGFLRLVKRKNYNEGNTMLHEAMIILRDNKCSIGGKVLKAFEPYRNDDNSVADHCYKYALDIANHAKQSVLYLAVVGGDKEAVQLILGKCPKDSVPVGLSPVVAAILKRDSDMLSTILQMKPEWIHLMDTHERLPLHYAASSGYHEGVIELLKRCKCCSIHRDKYGYFPLHLASHGGHVEVVKELLNYCPNPAEMLTNSHERNFLHIAAKNGKHEVIQYILKEQQNTQYNVSDMINQKDKKGDTPLHLAARSCHPKTVYYLASDNRVNLGLLNQNNQTALDVVTAVYLLDSSSLRQRLTWTALKSAGAKLSSSSRVVYHVESKLLIEKDSNSSEPHVNPVKSKPKINSKEVNKHYKDRVDTLILVSTLIITASMAACLAVPGQAEGKANNLNHAMFQFFIIFITISFFSSTSATIILLWARLGLIELLIHSVQIAMPVLGMALISLFLAFMAGLYTVISELLWLSNIFLFITGILIVFVVFLYMLLFLPSSSTSKPLRYISHHPFLYLASLTEPKSSHGINL